MRICPNCGFSNKDESEYCEACGANLNTPLKDVDFQNSSSKKSSNVVTIKGVNESGFTPIYGKRLRFTCPKCGNPVDEKSKKCPNCKAKIKTTTSFWDEEVERRTRYGRTYFTTRRKELIEALIIIAILIIGSILYFTIELS